MHSYEKNYNKLTLQEKVYRLEVLCKTYLMYLDVIDKNQPNLFMKDATIFWEGFVKEMRKGKT